MSNTSISQQFTNFGSDDYLAFRFASKYRDVLRFVAAWGLWLWWDGTRWQRDTTLVVQNLVREFSRKLVATLSQNTSAKGKEARDKLSQKLTKARTFEVIERLARTDPRLAATPDQWDVDPWLLGTPGGTVDLKSGTLRPARQGDSITKVTSVAPDFTASSPLWDSFRSRIFAGDGELIRFMDRLLGYGITGLTVEQRLPFLYGTGGNGKGVYTETTLGVMGDYGQAAPMETFMKARFDRHPTEMADFAGARFVLASEVEQGAQWNLSRVKQLTGSDTIRARRMREDFWSYKPQFLLLLSGNHRPHLDTIDPAIKRRLLLIPFNVTIPEAEQDRKLITKLRAEWPAILASMIRGCVEWQRTGLNPPLAVLAATRDYIEQEDVIGQWVDEWCERDATAFSTTTELHAAYCLCRPTNETQMPISDFRDALLSHGFKPARRPRGNGFTGLRLKTPEGGGPGSSSGGSGTSGGTFYSYPVNSTPSNSIGITEPTSTASTSSTQPPAEPQEVPRAAAH